MIVFRRKLSTFGREILTRIFGPVYEGDVGWRLKHNEELCNCYMDLRYCNIRDSFKMFPDSLCA